MVEYKSLLNEIKQPLEDSIKYVEKLQRSDGSYPWGVGPKPMHEKNRDMAAHAMHYLFQYYGKLTPQVILTRNYLLREQQEDRIELNPWLNNKPDPKISAVFVKTVGPIVTSRRKEILRELEFIDSKISENGEPQLPGDWSMQTAINAAYDILQAYAVTGRRDTSKARSVENYLLGHQHPKGYLDSVGLLDENTLSDSGRSMTTDRRLELTTNFVHTFINFLNYGKGSAPVAKAGDFLDSNEYSRASKYNSVALGIFNALLDLEKDLDRHMYLLKKSLERPIGQSIQDDVHKAGQLVRLRDKLEKKLLA